MTEYKFGEEVEINIGLGWLAGYRYGFYMPTCLSNACVNQSGEAVWATDKQIRRPRKLVKARFQPMVIRGFSEADPIMVIEREVDIYWQKWRKVGNIIEIEVDISEQS